MITGINLLEKSAVETKDLTALKRKNTVYSILILVSFLIINTTVFLYSFFQTKKLNELRTLAQAKKAEVVGFKEKEIKYQVIKEKLTFLSSIPQEKVDFVVLNKLVDYISEIEKTGVLVNSLDISEKGINFTAKAKDSAVLSSALNSLVDGKTANNLFKTVELRGLSQGKDGSYLLGVDLILN